MASTEEVLVWTPELEVSLFHSMKGHKPVGESVCYFQTVVSLLKFFNVFFRLLFRNKSTFSYGMYS